jgi:hypothetical protein
MKWQALVIASWLATTVTLVAALDHPSEFPAGSTDLVPANKQLLESIVTFKTTYTPPCLSETTLKSFPANTCDIQGLDLSTPIWMNDAWINFNPKNSAPSH